MPQAKHSKEHEGGIKVSAGASGLEVGGRGGLAHLSQIQHRGPVRLSHMLSISSLAAQAGRVFRLSTQAKTES